MNKENEIIQNALSYLGKTERSGNSGFTDPKFEIEMKEEGWQKGWAWCSVFAKVIFKNVYPERVAELDRLFSPGTIQTFKNFKQASYPISAVPKEGDLVIWQTMKEGRAMQTGHAGVVVQVVDQDTFYSVEGNTNDGGGREGYIVSKKLRNVIPNVQNGLKVLGFISV